MFSNLFFEEGLVITKNSKKVSHPVNQNVNALDLTLVSGERHPKVSVVTVNYNGKNFLRNCIQSLLKTNYPNFEIVVVDNGSTDNSMLTITDLADAHPDMIRVLLLSKNSGFTGGNSAGVKVAQGEIIVMLNNDTVVDPNWMMPLVRLLVDNPSTGIVQSKLMFMNQPSIVESMGAYIDRCGYGAEIGLVSDTGFSEELIKTFYANGASMAFRKEILSNISPEPDHSPFDPRYFLAYEDVDFSWLVHLAGYDVVLVPQSVVYHFRSGTSSKVPSLLLFHHTKNRIATLIKNYSLINVCKYLPLLVCFENVRAALCLKNKNPTGALSMFKGILWNISNIKETLKRRTIIQKQIRKRTDPQLFMLIKNVSPCRLLNSYTLNDSFSEKTGINIRR